MYPTPCTLAVRTNPKQMLSFPIRNHNRSIPSVAFPIFRCPEQARDFRDRVLNTTDTTSYMWTVSLCYETNEATFQTHIEQKQNTFEENIQPTRFHYDDEEFINKLIFREIGCLIIGSFYLNQQNDTLSIDGHLWRPYTVDDESRSSGYINLSSDIESDS